MTRLVAFRSVLYFLALLGLLALATGTSGCAPRAVIVASAPPPARVDVRPGPPPAVHVWIPGHWAHRSGRYTWVSGRWDRSPRARAVWVLGHWKHVRGGHQWVPGYWR